MIRIAREGWPWILVAGGAGGTAALLRKKYLGLAAAGVTGALVWFFRDPSREPVPDRELLISPADGVVSIVRYYPEYEGFPGPVYRVGIFMRLYDVHVNRAPVPGRILQVISSRGRKLPASWDPALEWNEKRLYWMERDDGIPILVVQVAGLLARRTVSYVRPGDEVLTGDRLGMIKFGSRVEVFFPAEGTRVLVREGHRVRAGETPLALLPWKTE
ncbi:MAG TPA: phosphatidylserine decarboxylase family protein [Thermosulfurimonas dismutans]|uniref:Phosphatidylserine decarboxylase proenzyme n=1 Tax=Thermosulfurimonas dismutans TaxID=999894 RepID=A0A7C3CKF9_9BACT|nr:phosphatidylserine decarboxylase family protein [Thermosulfurimonas dismutans]